ncbi:hypothetical protein CC80DRAFT_538805 [Byssothecium circinans]|uniref:Uncharacterized protein n=1 Tax=Byssothecium circinans TaxID=147558 RepID=A0A6A5TL21_9PLEO|nr:hypothetical protein CC80DRAFT_538805 [Byssothecium circinans]
MRLCRLWETTSSGNCPSSIPFSTGSVPRNHLTYINLTRTYVTPSTTEVGCFATTPAAGDLAFSSVADITSNLPFAAATVINSPTTAASQIDRVLNTMLYESKPVYIGLPLAVAG